MGDRTWVQVKCRKIDLDKIRKFLGEFDEIIEEDEGWIEGQFYEGNYGLLTEMEEIAEAQGIPFTGSSGHGGEYGPAVFACDGKRLFHMGSSDNGYPYVEISKNGELLPAGVMQRIREYYVILDEAERMIEGKPPIPIEMRKCAGPCEGTLENGAACLETIKKSDPENLCHCCGLYFCDACWDKHDQCEPCSDCGQMHITTPCPV